MSHVWMFFVDRRFIIGAAVEWHLPFKRGDAITPRSRKEYEARAVWGREDLGFEKYVQSCESNFVAELPNLYSAFQKAVERGEPDSAPVVSEPNGLSQ